jgi:hypothetical protein
MYTSEEKTSVLCLPNLPVELNWKLSPARVLFPVNSHVAGGRRNERLQRNSVPPPQISH